MRVVAVDVCIPVYVFMFTFWCSVQELEATTAQLKDDTAAKVH